MKDFKSKNLAKKALNRNEMKGLYGGRMALISDCAEGSFSCTCNGKDYGCVSSVTECWNKC
jgi:hypothetical protein